MVTKIKQKSNKPTKERQYFKMFQISLVLIKMEIQQKNKLKTKAPPVSRQFIRKQFNYLNETKAVCYLRQYGSVFFQRREKLILVCPRSMHAATRGQSILMTYMTELLQRVAPVPNLIEILIIFTIESVIITFCGEALQNDATRSKMFEQLLTFWRCC